jgi:mannan endo-1,4-beta-mannosidase
MPGRVSRRMFRPASDDVAAVPAAQSNALEWIEARRGLPYFVTQGGSAWTPIGDNNAVTWPELKNLFRRRDLAGVEAFLRHLKNSGVTVIRLMLEYAQHRHRYFERPAGRFVPAMVQLWDDLFALCEQVGMRLLLTPVDTYWTWLHWKDHPWNRAKGGPLAHPSEILTCTETRDAIKARLEFATRRWGHSGALFAWDLWNEIHPAQAGWSAEPFPSFIHDISAHLRKIEREMHGRTHPQTVSLFGPELWWRPEMPLKEPLLRHPELDFATIHIYREGTIDDPRDTITPALDMGRIVQECIADIHDDRPFLDTEHGPIHTYKDKGRTLFAPFDDEYFRHMQWAHLASGGAGGGMRWPNRTPHVLTQGMRAAQAALSRFLPLIEWTSFRRRPLALNLPEGIAGVGCGDSDQAVVWLVRTSELDVRGMSAPRGERTFQMQVPKIGSRVEVDLFDTWAGCVLSRRVCDAATVPVLMPRGDLALAIRAI